MSDLDETLKGYEKYGYPLWRNDTGSGRAFVAVRIWTSEGSSYFTGRGVTPSGRVVLVGFQYGYGESTHREAFLSACGFSDDETRNYELSRSVLVDSCYVSAKKYLHRDPTGNGSQVCGIPEAERANATL